MTPSFQQRYRSIFLLILFVLAGCVSPGTYSIERKVKELCRGDGGITVFTEVNVPDLPKTKLPPGYSERYENTEIERRREVGISRIKTEIYRDVDGYLIARKIDYTGAGPKKWWGESEYFRCSDKSLTSQIFKVNK